MYISLHVKYPLFLSDFNIAIFSKKISYKTFYSKPSSGHRVVPWEKMDRQTDITKLIVAFHAFTNAPTTLHNVTFGHLIQKAPCYVLQFNPKMSEMLVSVHCTYLQFFTR
jgi:hypothetical protein